MSTGNFFSLVFWTGKEQKLLICEMMLVIPDDMNNCYAIQLCTKVYNIVMPFSGPPRDITQRPVYGGGRERGWEEGGSRGGGR